MTKYKYIIGIDEAGRGPLAGSVAVGAVVIPAGFNMRIFKDANDSKKLTPVRRDIIIQLLKKEKNKGALNYVFASTGPEIIDKIGIVKATHRAVSHALSKLKTDSKASLVLLDGSLWAPHKFIYQRTIIRGDEKIKVISLASIVAKVGRDKKMIILSKKYPSYNFEKHKGYGTKLHYNHISKYGICDIHRRSFLKKLTK